MQPTREHEIRCRCCEQVIRSITVGDVEYWKHVAKINSIRVEGSYSSDADMGELRRIWIGQSRFNFLRSDIQKHWPEVEELVKKVDLL